MISYTHFPKNLGLCPECKKSNVFQAPDDTVTCTNPVCSRHWDHSSQFINAQSMMIREYLQKRSGSTSKQNTTVLFRPDGTVEKISGGIEWTATILKKAYRKGFTLNPLGGCFHGCKWIMPDGTIAVCYAKSVAERLATAAYPKGFEHLYWHPERLYDGQKLNDSRKIFIDSMSDLFGVNVPSGYIFSFLRAVEDTGLHIYQCLTKNAPRVAQFNGYLPDNLHMGFSSPPDFWMEKQLTRNQQERMLHKALKTFGGLDLKVRWASFEPLSWDVSRIVEQYPGVLQWAVIGAASNGPVYYQPEPGHVQNLLDVLDAQGVPVFFKGNLDWTPMRYEFPEV